MSTDDNKARMRRMWEDCWNQKRLGLVDELLTADIVLHVMGKDKVGRDMIAPTAGGVWFGSFPGLDVSVTHQVAEGGMVAERLIFTGTHTGTPYIGIPASSKPFTFFNCLRQLGATIKQPKPAETEPALRES